MSQGLHVLVFLFRSLPPEQSGVRSPKDVKINCDKQANLNVALPNFATVWNQPGTSFFFLVLLFVFVRSVFLVLLAAFGWILRF